MRRLASSSLVPFALDWRAEVSEEVSDDLRLIGIGLLLGASASNGLREQFAI